MENVGFPVSIQCSPFTIIRCPGRSIMGSERLWCSSASGLCVFALVVVVVVVVVLPPTRVVMVGASVCVGAGLVMVVVSWRYCGFVGGMRRRLSSG